MRGAFLLGIVALFGVVGLSAGSAEAQGNLVTVDGSPVQTQIVVGDDGDTYVGVWIQAPNDLPSRRDRAPMAVSLVVDVSGSMAGEKIANARSAAQSLLESLREGDLVSIYAFSDDVYEIAAPTIVQGGVRGDLIRRVAQLRDLGSTNLYGGLAAGIARMQQAPPSHPIRRVMVISDGQANVGPSDPGSLGNLAAGASEAHAQVTAIGVGLDYDENTLGALAVRSAGRLYHLADPTQMAAIIREEIGLMASTVATAVTIEVRPAPGVVIVDGLTMGATMDHGMLRIPVGSLVAGQSRELLFRARLDTARVGTRPLATARVVYEAPGAAAPASSSVEIPYTVTNDATAAARSRAPRVAALVATREASEASLAAAQAMQRGDARAADAAFARAEVALNEAAAAAPRPAEAEEARARRGRIQTARRAAASAAATGGAPSAPAARGATLDAFDAAYDMAGY